MVLDEKRTVLFGRVMELFGEVAIGKEEAIARKLNETLDLDLVEYDDARLRVLLNDTIYSTFDNLFTKYIVPPFSVLDTRQGYWTERRNKCLTITGNLSATRTGEYGTVGGGGRTMGKFGNDFRNGASFNNINEGTSNFDPVLAEVMMRWFNTPQGKILDPFGGEQTKGVVAGVLGYPYHGCEIRQDQVDYNRAITTQFKDINYVCGDSNDIDELITEREFDMVFTSPPYFDLEVYSATDMSSLPTYKAFMGQLENIYQKCSVMLNDNRFFVVKVGEIRDKKGGMYRNFVGDTIEMCMRMGLHYYNEIILVNSVGTAPMRANGTFRTRKIVKLHQNILVFYKGDIEAIRDIYTHVDTELPIKVPDQESLF